MKTRAPAIAANWLDWTQEEVRMEMDGKDLFIIVGDTKIAKRGHPGTPQAKTWIPLEPGFEVISSVDNKWTEIRYQGATLQ
jgi:hypothetical protein